MTSGSSLSPAKREHILDAAESVFLTVSYVDASMSEIIRRAGGSKATLYKHFGDKEGLFAAVIHRIAGKMLAELEVAVAGAEDTPEAFLTTFATKVTNFLLQPECRFVARTMAIESARFPTLAAAFHQAGTARILAVLEQRFVAWNKAGLVRIEDPSAMSQSFQDLLTTGVITRAMFFDAIVLTPQEVAARNRRLVGVFLNGVKA